jgi:F420-0:gamma-glutamyl ligase-like protein
MIQNAAERADDPETQPFEPNPGKELRLVVEGRSHMRIPLKTHTITSEDDPLEVAKRYAAPVARPGDMLAMSEKIVAITQGRSYPVDQIRPSGLAKLLARFVLKTKHGIGISSPVTMELAIREAGVPRMLFAALCSALTKPFGVRGVFYHVAGRGVAAIDGPTPYTLPPYNTCATLGPRNPNRVATEIAEALSIPVAIIDANDLGVEVLGASPNADRALVRALFRDNPLGQGSERTPLCILRAE